MEDRLPKLSEVFDDQINKFYEQNRWDRTIISQCKNNARIELTMVGDRYKYNVYTIDQHGNIDDTIIDHVHSIRYQPSIESISRIPNTVDSWEDLLRDYIPASSLDRVSETIAKEYDVTKSDLSLELSSTIYDYDINIEIAKLSTGTQLTIDYHHHILSDSGDITVFDKAIISLYNGNDINTHATDILISNLCHDLMNNVYKLNNAVIPQPHLNLTFDTVRHDIQHTYLTNDRWDSFYGEYPISDYIQCIVEAGHTTISYKIVITTDNKDPDNNQLIAASNSVTIPNMFENGKTKVFKLENHSVIKDVLHKYAGGKDIDKFIESIDIENGVQIPISFETEPGETQYNIIVKPSPNHTVDIDVVSIYKDDIGLNRRVSSYYFDAVKTQKNDEDILIKVRKDHKEVHDNEY